MGRSRLTLKRIASDTCRKSTFKQRRDVLVNKMQELSNLCKTEEGEAAKACLIVYDTNGGDPQPMTWPGNLMVEHSLIQRFVSEKNDEPPTIFDIQDYFNNKKEKVEADISKVRKEILKIQYPTSHPNFNNLGNDQITNFIAILDAKSRACNERMNTLKLEHQVEMNLAQTSSATQLMANNNARMNSANQIGLPSDCAIQSNDVEVSTNQFGDVDWDSLTSGFLDSECALQSDDVGVSTNQLGDVDWDSLTCGFLDDSFDGFYELLK